MATVLRKPRDPCFRRSRASHGGAACGGVLVYAVSAFRPAILSQALGLERGCAAEDVRKAYRFGRAGAIQPLLSMAVPCTASFHLPAFVRVGLDAGWVPKTCHTNIIRGGRGGRKTGSRRSSCIRTKIPTTESKLRFNSNALARHTRSHILLSRTMSESHTRHSSQGGLGVAAHMYTHTCMHAYIHTCIHACIHAYMHAYIHACIHAYIFIKCLCVCMYTHAHKRTHIGAICAHVQ